MDFTRYPGANIAINGRGKSYFSPAKTAELSIRNRISFSFAPVNVTGGGTNPDSLTIGGETITIGGETIEF